jgi:thiol-disulfide isomerase/thioredoxin
LFCASWCPFCQSFFPAFDKSVAKRNFDRTVRVYLDDYDNPLWDEFSIEAVPTVILFDQGKVAGRLDAKLGLGLDEKKFSRWLEQV